MAPRAMVELTPDEFRHIQEAAAGLKLSCRMCGNSGPPNWVIRREMLLLRTVDSDRSLGPDTVKTDPIATLPVAALECVTCRYLALFRVVGPDSPPPG